MPEEGIMCDTAPARMSSAARKLGQTLQHGVYLAVGNRVLAGRALIKLVPAWQERAAVAFGLVLTNAGWLRRHPYMDRVDQVRALLALRK